MRADRLLSMLWELMAHEHLTAAALANRLEVSVRTILRDVEALSTAGVPVYCERGRGGGVHLLPGFRTRVTGLNEEETRALFLTVTAPAADALGWGPALASGVRKLMAAMPGEHRPIAAEVMSRLVIDPEGWLPRRPIPSLEPLLDAALTSRQLRVSYRSRRSGQVWQDTVDPYGLLSAGGSWYLVVGRGGQERFLRVDRLVEVAVLDQPASRPAELDLRKLWQERRADFRQRTGDPLTVTVVLAPDRLSDARDWSADLIDHGPRAEPETEPPGWHRADLEFGSPDHAFGVLHRLGGDVQVVEPQWLIDRLTSEASRVLARYTAADAGQYR